MKNRFSGRISARIGTVPLPVWIFETDETACSESVCKLDYFNTVKAAIG